MTAKVVCPKCGGSIHVRLSGVLSPDPSKSHIEVTPEPFSLRRHAQCFGGGPDGGEPVVTLMPSAKGFGRRAA